MTLINAQKRALPLGYEVEKGTIRRYRFRKLFSPRWAETDDLYAMLAYIGDKSCSG